MKKTVKDRVALREFLMTLAATTVSIVLTFGTTAIIDRKKQNAEKREMVMMVLYDMRESLENMKACRSNLEKFFDIQMDAVAHPRQYDEKYVELISHFPVLDYVSTTENIFRSNIETINTIGNILFIETVSSFYDKRALFRTEVVEEFSRKADKAIRDYQSLSEFNVSSFVYFSTLYLRTIQLYYDESKQMMKVSDEDLDVFSSEHKAIEEAVLSDNVSEDMEKIFQENRQRILKWQEAKEEGRKNL